jgi:hypothetical protein
MESVWLSPCYAECKSLLRGFDGVPLVGSGVIDLDIARSIGVGAMTISLKGTALPSGRPATSHARADPFR